MVSDPIKNDVPKKGRGKHPIDPFNPDTWPADSKRRLEREMHIKDVMCGRKIHNSPKAMFMEEFRLKDSNAYGKNVWMDEDILERVSDIQAMHKIGAFRFIPLSVRDQYAQGTNSPLPFDVSKLSDPKSKPWEIKEIIRMSLNVMLLYLMGLDTYTNRVMRHYLSMDLHKVGYRKAANAVELSANFKEKYESDDDFDFSDLGFDD
tara:strand:- start:4 stop:618 length:615 start_codon:yes stop_codon:yes gene_type:complete